VRKHLKDALAGGLIVLFIFGVVLTASRTGMLGMLFLCMWGLLDRSLPRAVRLALTGAPVLYGICWGGMWLLSHTDKAVTFAAEARLHDKSDISSSRFKIWANVLALIRANPLWGVGYGEFNLAWTFTPFPTRPVAFFDHTHDLLLQWAVEFGLPVAAWLTLLALLGLAALCWPSRHADAPASWQGAARGACAVMVAMAGLHSLLEYPLWYSYFLLPTAFAWGAGLGVNMRRPSLKSAPSGKAPLLRAAGVATMILVVWCAWDYMAAANIYAPRPGAGPLAERIAYSQRQPWWGYQADYAGVTTVDDDEPSRPPEAFRRTLHNLADARLLIAYARSLAEHGEVDKARFVVQRLQEFHNPLGQAFMAECEAAEGEGPELFQCEAPKGHYTWRELLP
jgi:hypothetical protein